MHISKDSSTDINLCTCSEFQMNYNQVSLEIRFNKSSYAYTSVILLFIKCHKRFRSISIAEGICGHLKRKILLLI
jgi:hypothetical protein